MASISASHSNISIVLDVSETYVDTNGNYSDVSWTLRMVRPYDISSSVNKNYYVNIDGNETRGTVIVGGKGNFDIATGSHRIYHDADGSKSIGISFSQELNLSYNGWVGTLSAEGSMGLTKINRQATIINAYDFTDEENPHFTFTNPGGYTMNVWLEPNPNGEHLCVRNNIPNTGSYTWSLTEEEWDALRDKCSGQSCTVRIGLYTNINGTLLASYQDKTMTIVRGKSQANYKVNGEWKKALAFIKVNGEWKKSKVYKKINNEWKEGH